MPFGLIGSDDAGRGVTFIGHVFSAQPFVGVCSVRISGNMEGGRVE
jgi:hypothetical protein